MKKQTKKRIIIILIVVAAALAVLLTAGYIAVNMAFSIFTDSFYQSATVTEAPAASAEPEAAAENAGETAKPEGSSGGQEGGSLPQGSVSIDKLQISAEKVKELEQKVAFSDKVAVLNILSTGLSGADYRELIGMINNGITADEVHKAYRILKENLSQEDKNKIWGYYHKYAHFIQ